MKRPIYFVSKPLLAVIGIVIPFLIFGCRTAKISRNNSTLYADTIAYKVMDAQTLTSSMARMDYRRDSVVIRDSIYIHDGGDTIIRERWHTSVIYRDINSSTTTTDTIHNTSNIMKDTKKTSVSREEAITTTRSLPPTWLLVTLVVIIVSTCILLFFHFR